MSLTKQECENVLSETKIYLKNQMQKKERIRHSVYLLNTITYLFEKLIHEYFDNPPLKFEELEVGKPYWDNLKECWFIVTEYDPTSYYKYKEINWYLDKNDACYLENIYENEFDENRYYRKQVEE